jgi:ABC-type Mn2+/Zn2+ transport system ATPase subunit
MTAAEPSTVTASPAVRTHDLAVGHARLPVVDGLDLLLPPGRVLALVGSNGSGKSTLLKTLVGLLEPLGGTLEVLGGNARRSHGRSPNARGDRDGGGGVAYLGQFHTERTPLPLRALDVVRMGRFARLGLWGRLRAADHDAVQRAMDRMGITPLADAAVRSLSGGQRQRVYLAQVLAAEADLLLLDEPTAGLDAPGHERYEAAVADEVARGAAVVVATHDIGEAARADQVLLLARRVVAYGPPGDVLRPDHLLETFGVALRDVGGLLVRTGDDHGHDVGHGHGHGHAHEHGHESGH